ncbi:hypothetical protein CANARDRAFT_160567 [[Candida] arabinofermentans NRRL YB-2248]|uniref:Tubulin binding cofactor C-like domain-containing protein n=1 Tax=[Candida] arabinofermentans NRRL YB-2248 TaxID=983967 RepID=A0A1E4T0B8_9ASCO|nr:hypothetical protein CANARDRAFT_160567 [[Candida] arabinofermentans NRRL YB-2248]
MTDNGSIAKEFGLLQTVDELQLIRSKIFHLKAWLAERSDRGQVAPYDLKKYSRSIDQYVLKLDDKRTSLQKRKFRFTIRPPTVSNDKEPPISASGSKKIWDAGVGRDEAIGGGGAKTVHLKDKSYETIRIPSAASITLENCTSCVFELSSQSFLFVTNCNGCAIKGDSQQVRVHDTKETLIDINITSPIKRLVLERCSSIYIVRSQQLTVDDFSNLGRQALNYCLVESRNDSQYGFEEVGRNIVLMPDESNGSRDQLLWRAYRACD